jgi:hypothetical protein
MNIGMDCHQSRTTIRILVEKETEGWRDSWSASGQSAMDSGIFSADIRPFNVPIRFASTDDLPPQKMERRNAIDDNLVVLNGLC